MDGNDLLFGSATVAFGFTSPREFAEAKADGDDLSRKVSTIQGRVTALDTTHRRALLADSTGFKQGKPLYWSADNKPTPEKTERPVMDPVLTLQTALRSWEGLAVAKDTEDLGSRRVFLKGRRAKQSLMDAVRDACSAVKVRKVNTGDFLEITCVGEGKKGPNKSISPPKLYKATYWPASNPPPWADSVNEGLAVEVDDDESEDLFS